MTNPKDHVPRTLGQMRTRVYCRGPRDYRWTVNGWLGEVLASGSALNKTRAEKAAKARLRELRRAGQ